MKAAVALLMAPVVAHAGTTFEGYEAFYATLPDTLFHGPGVELQPHAHVGDEEIHYGWSGVVAGRRQALELRDGAVTLDGRVLSRRRVHAFPGETVDRQDLGMGSVAHFAPGWLCVEGTPASASGSAGRHRAVYLIRRGKRTDDAWRLPSLFGHCASIRLKGGQILIQQAIYRYADGQDMATGLTLHEFAMAQGTFKPTGVKISLSFPVAGNVYQFQLDEAVSR